MHPHVHPGTAAVNQTPGSLAIKGRTFATDNHSISKSHQMDIQNIKKKIGILTIATGIFVCLFLPSAIDPCGDVMRFQKFYFVTSYNTKGQLK